MRRVDYDDVASTYNRRYERNRSEGVRAALHEFLGDGGNLDVAEIGCGTGHWLADIADRVRSEIGIDASWEMLRRAAADASTALLIRARAEEVPLASACVDQESGARVVCRTAQHLPRGVDPDLRSHTFRYVSEPVPGSASYLGNVQVAGVTKKLVERGSHALGSVSFVATIVRRRDVVVVDATHQFRVLRRAASRSTASWRRCASAQSIRGATS